MQPIAGAFRKAFQTWPEYSGDEDYPGHHETMAADAACQPDRGLAAAPMAASLRRGSMTLLTQAVMVRANIDVDRMSAQQKVELADEIYVQQPSCSPSDPRAAGQDGMTGRSLKAGRAAAS